ncbi:MAG: hypothetical protein AB7V46_02075 [Thermomicrobiales bacterium]
MTAMTEPLVERSVLPAVEASRRRGVEFLLQHVNSDGSIVNADRPRVTWYRFPWALEVSGETAAAFRVLSWIERDGLGADGQFHGGIAWDEPANRTTNTYPETILAYGAWLLRRPDIARRTMANALPYQDPATGGIWMTRERTGPADPQLLFPTAQFGMSAVLTGHLDAGSRAGEWMTRLWDAQPDLPSRLLTIWTAAGGLLTEAPGDIDPRHVVNDARLERQLHYNGGIAAAFLTHLYMATGEARWLDYARKFQAFSIESCEEQFLTKQVCKSAWGSGLLYLATKDTTYLPWIEKMGLWFAAGQDSDGGWSNTPYIEASPPLKHRLETTAEFVVHLDTVIAALAAAQAA